MSTYISSVQQHRSARLRRNSNLNSRVAERKGLGPISNALFMSIILTIMGILYLSQVTKARDYSFTLDNLDKEKESLIEENQALSIEAARLSKIENVQNSGVAKSLTSPKSIDFVR